MINTLSSSFLSWLVVQVSPSFAISLEDTHISSSAKGLNITSCNNVILLEPWWNPFAEVCLLPLSAACSRHVINLTKHQEQAISRVHRIGQTLPVNVYRLITEDSLEESILAVRPLICFSVKLNRLNRLTLLRFRL